jgi:hypothetical protein
MSETKALPLPFATTNEETFLKKEFAAFKGVVNSYETYLAVFQEDVTKCNLCGVFYWNNCVKRCNCA